MRNDQSPRYVSRCISRISNAGGQFLSSMAIFAVLLGGLSLASVSHDPELQVVPVVWSSSHLSHHDEDGDDHTASISNQRSFEKSGTTLVDFIDAPRVPKSQPVRLCQRTDQDAPPSADML